MRVVSPQVFFISVFLWTVQCGIEMEKSCRSPQIAKKSQRGYNRIRLERKQVEFLHEPVAVCHIHAVLLPGAASRGQAIETTS